MSELAASNVEALVTFGFALTFGAVCAYLFRLLYKRLRKIGYQSPFTTLLMCGAYIAAVGLGGLVVWGQSDLCWSCSPEANPQYYRPELIWPRVAQFMWSFATGMGLGLAATAFVVRFVPVRPRRAWPRRARFPWKAAARTWLAVIPISAILIWSFHLDYSLIVRIGLFCFGAYAACSYWAKQQERAAGDGSIHEDDPRPPVLYLRPFDREDEAFAMPTNGECTDLGISIRNPNSFRQLATVEQYLAGTISERLGPFTALGDPNDYLPPAGAARAYVDDTEWQDAFLRMSRASACILITPGISDNLNWELASIRTERLQRKVFAVTRPAYPHHWYSIASWLSRRGRRDWNAFRRVLDQCGYSTSEYPGEGAIIGFDDSGKMIAVGSNARTPGQYVAALEKCLQEPPARGGGA